MAFKVQSTVSAAFGIVETVIVKALENAGNAIPFFGPVKAVMEGIVSIVAAAHAATINPLNGFQVPDLPFKDEMDLQGTEVMRAYVKSMNEPKTVAAPVPLAKQASFFEKLKTTVNRNRGIIIMVVLVVMLFLFIRYGKKWLK